MISPNYYWTALMRIGGAEGRVLYSGQPDMAAGVAINFSTTLKSSEGRWLYMPGVQDVTIPRQWKWEKRQCLQ